MRLRILSVAIILTISLAGCASVKTTAASSKSSQANETSQTKIETTSAYTQLTTVENNLFDVKITFPASTFIGEGVSESLIETEAKKQGIHQVIFNEDKSFTYVMDKSTHLKLLSDMKVKIDESIDELIHGEDKVESFSEIEYNYDFTEFAVYVDGHQYKETDSFSAIQFYILGGYYQVLNGVDYDKTNVTVKFIDMDTGEILNTANSAEEMNK